MTKKFTLRIRVLLNTYLIRLRHIASQLNKVLKKHNCNKIACGVSSPGNLIAMHAGNKIAWGRYCKQVFISTIGLCKKKAHQRETLPQAMGCQATVYALFNL